MKKQDKGLLNEAAIRRMMGLAGIPAVNEGEFIDSYRKQYFEAEEEEAPIEEPAAEEPAPEEAPLEGEPAMDAAAPADEASVEELVQAIATAITDTTGVEVDAGGEAAAEEAPLEEPMPEEDPMAADAAPAEEPAPEEEMPMEESAQVEANLANALAAAGIQLNLDNDELVAEVTKRVAARLVREARKTAKK
mgnify:FL=1